MSRESKATKEEIQRNRDEAYQNGWGDGYAEGFGKATEAAIAALPARGVGVKPLVFNWTLDAASENPSCWHCSGEGFFARVLIPYDPGNDPAAGIGTWNANPNHRGKMGFASRQEAMNYCEKSIRTQANAELQSALAALQRWSDIAALEPAPTDAAHVNETPKSEHDAGNVLTDAAQAPAEDAHVKGETAGQMLERLGMDGAKWAAEFRTTALRLGYSDMDEGWLIGWFCNAIMAGYDRSAAQAREAALKEAAAVADEHTFGGAAVRDAILALLSEART